MASDAPAPKTISDLRFYWLGPATEPGLWAIDTGPGTKIVRVDGLSIEGIIDYVEHLQSEKRPRGWNAVRHQDARGKDIHDFTFVTFTCPAFQKSGRVHLIADAVVEFCERYGVEAF